MHKYKNNHKDINYPQYVKHIKPRKLPRFCVFFSTPLPQDQQLLTLVGEALRSTTTRCRTNLETMVLDFLDSGTSLIHGWWFSNRPLGGILSMTSCWWIIDMCKNSGIYSVSGTFCIYIIYIYTIPWIVWFCDMSYLHLRKPEGKYPTTPSALSWQGWHQDEEYDVQELWTSEKFTRFWGTKLLWFCFRWSLEKSEPK